MAACTALVRIPVAELDETYIGTRLLITTDSGTVCGGVSDVAQSIRIDLRTGEQHRCVLVWIAGDVLLLGSTSCVVTEAPPQH